MVKKVYKFSHISLSTSSKDSRVLPIASQVYEILNNAGYLFIEHGYDQSDLVVSIFERCGFSQIRTYKDLNGDDRVCSGMLKRC